MEIFLSFALVLVGFFLIVKGGNFLVRSALALSRLSGIPTVVVGATFVSLATTLPEIVISIYAILTQHEGLAVGNAVGGMLVSFSLIFALYAVLGTRPVTRDKLFLKSVFLFLSIGLVVIFSMDGRISMWEGFILGGIYFAYIALTSKGRGTTQAPVESHPTETKRQVFSGFLIGQLLLLFGAFLLVQNSERLAIDLGISETIVGLTLVAVGTSMPELVTVVGSVRHKSGDLAIGNIVGSNIINATLLLGLCGVVGAMHGAPLAIAPTTLFIAIPALVIASLVALVPILIKGRVFRAQGIVLLALFAIYIVALIFI